MSLHEDFIGFVSCMINNHVEFVIVGAHALGFYGIPRTTGDIDLWIRRTNENAKKMLAVVEQFFGTNFGYSDKDMLDEETIQFGVQPVRIDILKKLTGISDEEIWNTKVQGKFAEFDVYFISRELFIKNKKATGRRKDLFDAELLLDFDKK